jgi:pectate lyase
MRDAPAGGIAMVQSGTTGGSGGAHVQVAALDELVRHLGTNTTLLVEVMNDIDLSPLANASQGFPPEYPTGEVLVNSNKTLYSKNGSAIRRGTLRIGKGPNGRQNIIIRNLKSRDLWVLDPAGAYDEYGWDYISIEAGSHHIWVDHCDFERAYDRMVDIKGGSDFITVSWNVFRDQKKCNLPGHTTAPMPQRPCRGARLASPARRLATFAAGLGIPNLPGSYAQGAAATLPEPWASNPPQFNGWVA